MEERKKISRPNAKGHPRYGGRTKGTPNKVTSLTKSLITELLTKYYNSGEMERDFDSLEPHARLTIAEKFCQYVLPKQAAAKLEVENTAERKTISETLNELVNTEE